MNKDITIKNIKKFRKDFESCNHCKVTMNALTRSKLEDVSMNWEAFRSVDHNYSNIVKGEFKKVTNQKASGRCWGFAALNLMRIELAKKYNLENFEFSQSYFMFYDKLEKSNYFLENILKTLNLDFNSRIVMWLLNSPIQDGGQWDMFVNLVEKYGVVPQSAMPESLHTSSSRSMNQLITRTLRKFAGILRSEHEKGKSLIELRKIKIDMMASIHDMLCSFIGCPPEEFNWQIRDKKNKFLRFNDVTPLDFYKKFCSVKLTDKVCLIHCPMSNKKMNTLYTVSYLGNVVEGQPIKYLNVSIDDMKLFASKSIQLNEAVWFGCDVGKKFHRDLGVMDNDLYDYEALLGIDSDMDKKNRLEYGDSQMTHAMLFTGVDVVDNKPVKWRVENSWGNKSGDKGYFLMTDDWFSEYNYEVVIDKKYLSKKVLNLFEQKLVSLDPWDPMGALAR
jgi:bleomycin hydrolase